MSKGRGKEEERDARREGRGAGTQRIEVTCPITEEGGGEAGREGECGGREGRHEHPSFTGQKLGQESK